MKKVMFVIPTLANGGAERVVSVFASGLVEKGCKAIILRYYKTDEDYIVNDKVKVFTLCDNKSEYDRLSKLNHFKKIHKIFKEVDPDYIIPFLRHVNIHTVLASGRFFNRIVYTIRVYPALDTSVISKIHDFLINYTNKTIVQNNEQKEYFNKNAHKRIYVLSNPVDEKFLNISENKTTNFFSVVSAGRLSKQKNFSMLIRAFSKFSKDKKDVFLSIYGVGDEEENLQRLINDLDCQEKIKLMGRSNELDKVYSSASLFVTSSNYEGMPNALLEAMAAGLPCISTDCKSGPKEMIKNMNNGLLVTTGSEAEMIRALDFIYNNKITAREMGENARKSVAENYTKDKIIDEFLGFFK